MMSTRNRTAPWIPPMSQLTGEIIPGFSGLEQPSPSVRIFAFSIVPVEHIRAPNVPGCLRGCIPEPQNPTSGIICTLKHNPRVRRLVVRQGLKQSPQVGEEVGLWLGVKEVVGVGGGHGPTVQSESLPVSGNGLAVQFTEARTGTPTRSDPVPGQTAVGTGVGGAGGVQWTPAAARTGEETFEESAVDVCHVVDPPWVTTSH